MEQVFHFLGFGGTAIDGSSLEGKRSTTKNDVSSLERPISTTEENGSSLQTPNSTTNEDGPRSTTKEDGSNLEGPRSTTIEGSNLEGPRSTTKEEVSSVERPSSTTKVDVSRPSNAAELCEIPTENPDAANQGSKPDAESIQTSQASKQMGYIEPNRRVEGVATTSNCRDLVWIIPKVLYNDHRVRPALLQLAAKVHEKLEVRALTSSSITREHQRNVILPVVVASAVGSDLRHAVNKANLHVPPQAPVVLIFHCRARHRSPIRTSTKSRLSDRQLRDIVDSCTDMIDVVFWDREMYDCEVNTEAISKLREMWQILPDAPVPDET